MKTILRNFLLTIRRFRTASLLNVLGLSVAFAAFTVILMQVRYDREFDRFYSKAGRIFRGELSQDSAVYDPLFSRRMMELLLQTSGVESGSALQDEAFYGEKSYLTVEKEDGGKAGFKEYTARVFPEFTDLFDFKMREGGRDALKRPGTALIPASMARRFFGDVPAAGRQIVLRTDTTTVVTVGGVYEDFPANTQIGNRIYIPIDRSVIDPQDHWGNRGYYFFVTLYSPEDKTSIEESWLSQLNAIPHIQQWMPLKGVRLTALPDVYYESDTQFDAAPKGSRTTTGILLGIALLIVAVASVNFVNFATALTPVRIRSINIRKVLGSSAAVLRGALLVEAIGICLIAFVLALIWIEILGQTSFAGLLTAPTGLSENWPVIGLSFGLALAVGLLAGVYPACYITSFPPAFVLKGAFGMSPGGRKLRTLLVGFQFIVSIALIISSLFMRLQNDFMRFRDIGLDTERLALAELTEEIAGTKRQVLADRLKESPQVLDVSFGGSPPGSQDDYSSWTFGRDEGDKMITMQVLRTSWNQPAFLGVKVLEGRSFFETENGNSDYALKMLINDTARKKYGLQVGQTFINGCEIVGVMEDFNFQSLRNEIVPMTFMAFPGEFGNWLYVRTTGNPHTAAGDIRRAVAAVDPLFPVDVWFYDTVFNALYTKERNMAALIMVFSLLAVVISLMGVFGLILFETQHRKKEIGIRKVMGAAVKEILVMFNGRFVRIVAVCFVIAAPLAGYGIRSWLDSFAYRTPLYWWVFAFSLMVVMLITLTTVTVQSWRAATANPARSLQSE